jgi:hypothetical protein
MDLEIALKALEHARHPFPEEAIHWAMAHPAEITRPLLESLREPPARIMRRESSWFLNVFAMYLLAQFREKAAFEPIIDFQAAITGAEEALTEGVVTQGLGRILASLYPGDDLAIRRLIEDPEINEWVRGAAVGVYPSLLASGQTTRSEVVAYFRYLLDAGLERESSHVWGALALACGEIHPDGLVPSLESVYAADLIDSFYYSREDLRTDSELTPEQALEKAFAHRTPLTEDAVRELSWWACFQPPRAKPGPVRDTPSSPAVRAMPKSGTRTRGPKIGRNDPCPCGSGNKYKKCCLSGAWNTERHEWTTTCC